VREGAPVAAGTLRIWHRIGRATGAQAISLRVLEFAPGISPSMRNDECDEILYVLERRGRQTATIQIDRHGYDIGSQTKHLRSIIPVRIQSSLSALNVLILIERHDLWRLSRFHPMRHN